MKKILVVLMASLVLVACGGGAGSSAKLEMGTASTQMVNVKDDVATFETVIVGVTLRDGKVDYIQIDESQQKASIDGEKVAMETIKTKKELGTDYNMANFAEKGEWDVQVKAIEADLVGKTKDEVAAYFAGDDVKSSATITVDHFAATVAKAIDNAVEVKGAAKVGFGYVVSTSIGKTEDAPQSVVDYAMIAVDADGKIIVALTDNAQEKAKLTDGALVATNIGKSKGELKEGYAMKDASPIGKEWNEQNDAFMAAVVGKTVAEVSAFKAGEGDIATSVTIIIDSVQAAIVNAEKALVDVK